MVKDKHTDSLYWDSFRDTPIGQYLLAHEQGFVRHFLTSSRMPPRLLELCACTGRISVPLNALASHHVIADQAYVPLHHFQQQPEGAVAVQHDAQALPFVAGSFDCIVAIQCFRYLNHRRFLNECWRVLNDDGLLVLQIVNAASYKKSLKRLLKRSPGENIISTGEVRRLMSQAGFSSEQMHGYNWLPFKPVVESTTNHRVVHWLARLETGLQLRRLPSLSPWVLIAARKTSGTRR